VRLVDGTKEIDIEKIQVAEVKPGDVVILKLAAEPPSVRDKQLEQVSGMLQQMFPHNRVIILTAGAELSVARPADGGGYVL
jgi:hypothetical protein